MFIEGAVNQKYFKRNIWMPYKSTDIQQFRTVHNNKAIYLTPYRYSSPIQDSESTPLTIANLYFDMDSKTNLKDTFEDAKVLLSYLKSTMNIPIGQMQLYFSGNKGIHLIVSSHVFGFTLASDTHLRFKQLAKKIEPWLKNNTIDMIYDMRRLLRVENSRHEKSGLFKIPITPKELSMPEKYIKQKAESPRHFRRIKPVYCPKAREAFYAMTIPQQEISRATSSYALTLEFAPPCIQNLCNQEIQEPGRNKHLVILANYCIHRKYPQDKALAFLSIWNERCCQPPLPDDEIEKTYSYQLHKGGYNYGCGTLEEFGCEKKKCKIGRAILAKQHMDYLDRRENNYP